MANNPQQKLPTLRLPTFAMREPVGEPAAPAPLHHESPTQFPNTPMPVAPQPAPAMHYHAQPAAQYYQQPQQVSPQYRYQGPAPRPAQRPVAFAVSAGGAFADDQKSWFSPIHLGILATMIVVAWMVAQGPGLSMKANGTAIMPADPSAISAPPAGSGILPLRRDPQGIMSPAAAASLQFEKTGTLPLRSTASIKFGGIPSPAAAASLDPNPILPLRPSDGMSMPRSIGERDSYAAERAYGDDPGAAAHDAAPKYPVRSPGTPGESGDYSQNRAGVSAATGNPDYGAGAGMQDGSVY